MPPVHIDAPKRVQVGNDQEMAQETSSRKIRY